MLIDPSSFGLLVAALALDALIGDPEAVWRGLPHPVALFGRLIAGLDLALNQPAWNEKVRRVAGCAGVVVLLIVATGTGLLVTAVAHGLRLGVLLTIAVAAIFLAQNSLYRHVARVRAAFADGGLDAARAAVARIVGRDPQLLDEAGVCRAAVESCAENFSDGVVAPAFWFALAGLPGLIAYKAVNTADSMIGHRTPRHKAFGWAAARLDDLMNLIPARLAALLLALAAPIAGGSIAKTIRGAWRDGDKHRSPNAGWPESAMAYALGVKLGGPRTYEGVPTANPPLNAQGGVARPDDIRRALRCLFAACVLQAAVYMALALAI